MKKRFGGSGGSCAAVSLPAADASVRWSDSKSLYRRTMCHVRGSAVAAPPPSSDWWHTRIVYCTYDSSMISDDLITALILDAEIMVELAHSAAPGGRSPGLQGEALAV